MQSLDNNETPKIGQEEETDPQDITDQNENAEAEDTDPPLDEEELVENGLTVEEADQIEWEPAKAGSSGSEEKDITD